MIDLIEIFLNISVWAGQREMYDVDSVSMQCSVYRLSATGPCIYNIASICTFNF